VGDEIRAAGIEVTALGASSILALPVVLRRLNRLVRSRSIDTIFSFLVHANVSAAIIARFKKTIRSIQAIQTTQPYPRWHWWAQGMAEHQADHVVVPSTSVAAIAHARAHVPMEKITIIPNAIDPADFAHVGRPFMSHVPGAPVRVGFIGRLDPIKRAGDLIEACQLLGDAVQLHIYGDGEQHNELVGRVHQSPHKHRLVLHGMIRQPQDALSNIDMLVLPSDAEGFGLVLIEAMAAGVPVIGTDVPGIRDVVVHGLSGLLVPPRSPSTLALAIRQLIEDKHLRESLIAGGHERVATHFTWPGVVKQYRSLLQV